MTGKGRGCAKEGGDDDRVEPHVDVIFGGGNFLVLECGKATSYR